MTDDPSALSCSVLYAIHDACGGPRPAREILDALAEVAASVLAQAPPPQFAEEMLRFGLAVSRFVQQARALRAAPAPDPDRAGATLQ